MDILVFGKYSSDVKVNDPGLREYICLTGRLSFATQGRHAKKVFGKTKTNIVERLINSLMRGGTGEKLAGHVIRDRGGCGKKAKMYREARDAFDLINKKTGKNPVELLIRAIENSAPREETTRVKYGGVVAPIAVDVAPWRRINLALMHIGKAVAIRSFNSKKTAVEALAEEIMLAAQNDANSYAIGRKNETERTARSSR